MSVIVSTQKPSLLVILRREYLEITNGNFCAAKLTEYFKHWTKWKLKNHRTPWIYQPLKNIHADLMGEHSLHVIRSAIAFLVNEKILERRNNPNNQQDKTYQYQIHICELNKLLERRKCNLERSEFNAETHQQITDPQTSDPQKQAAEKEKSLEPDWNLVSQQVVAWEQVQLTDEPTSLEQPTINHYVDDNSQDFSTNGLTSHEGASPLPSDECEEENIKLCEVRDAIGKLTPKLRKLIVDFTLGDLRKALTLYRQRHQKQQIRDAYSWLKKCLQQKWWQDKPANNPSTDARKDVPESLAANEKLTLEQKVWYEKAINQGICLPAPIEELPIKMGLVCARVAIPNRKPYQLLFDILPIEELIAEYPL